VPANRLHLAGIRIGVCALLLSAAPLIAVAPQQLAAPDDQAIRTQIEARLVDKGFLGVNVAVHGHVATLTGSVVTLWAQEQSVTQTEKVRAVSDVVNLITIARGQSDAAMAMQIADDVGDSSYYTVFDAVTVRVGDGVADLSGYVTAAVKLGDFVRAASQVPGVQKVINRIETLPPSMNDDQIRYAVATSIYGALFPQYVNVHSGPIHIIVELGHVTLTGVVSSNTDRRLAEMFTHEVFGVMSVENRIAVETED
jgi:osmotically-inducible protein OsmY